MPRVERTPPRTASPTPSQSKTASESDSTTSSIPQKPRKIKTNVTARNKRQRIENSPDTPVQLQPQEAIVNLKSELLLMLSSWKEEQDQRLTSWKGEQDATLSLLVRDVSDLKNQCHQIQISNSEIEKGMEFVSQNYEEMRTQLAQLEREKQANSVLIGNLEQQILDLQLKSRSASIELRNVPTKADEKPADLLSFVSAVCGVVDINIQMSDLRDIYRLPGKSDTVRPIVAEFISVTKRTEILTSLRSYNKDRRIENKLNTQTIGIPGDKKPIYVDEHLTPAQKKLLFTTRKWAEPFGYKCWHSNGRILLKRSSDDKPIHIKSESCLRLLSKDK